MARIFISYRREDSGAWAGRLHDRLAGHFGRNNVFRDIDSIEPGLDFIEAIDRTVGSCDVLIALIGRQWLTLTDANGQRRLNDPEDFVRREIATALKQNIRVIPALVQDTSMPRAVDLPEDLQPLTRRNALVLSDIHFHSNLDSLIESLERVLGTEPPHGSSSTKTKTVGASPSRALFRWRDLWAWAGGGGCLLISSYFHSLYGAARLGSVEERIFEVLSGVAFFGGISLLAYRVAILVWRLIARRRGRA
jgi:hypothetical protein